MDNKMNSKNNCRNSKNQNDRSQNQSQNCRDQGNSQDKKRRTDGTGRQADCLPPCPPRPRPRISPSKCQSSSQQWLLFCL